MVYCRVVWKLAPLLDEESRAGWAPEPEDATPAPCNAAPYQPSASTALNAVTLQSKTRGELSAPQQCTDLSDSLCLKNSCLLGGNCVLVAQCRFAAVPVKQCMRIKEHLEGDVLHRNRFASALQERLTELRFRSWR